MFNWVALLSLLVISATTTKIIHYYSSKSTKYYVLCFVFLGFFFAFGLVGLVPYDVYLSITPETSSGRTTLYILWEVVYWVLFVQCW